MEADRDRTLREMSVGELLLRNVGKFAAVSGVIGVVIWLSWVMLDVKHLHQLAAIALHRLSERSVHAAPQVFVQRRARRSHYFQRSGEAA